MSIARFVVAICALVFSNIAMGGTAFLTWDAPTLNDDGSPYLDPHHYTAHGGCIKSGQYEEQQVEIPYTITSLTMSALPEGGTCYFVVTATNQSGQVSQLSAEATKTFNAVFPGAVTDTQITWQESVVANAFSNLTEGQSTSQSTDTASFTVGDDEVVYVTVILAVTEGSSRTAGSDMGLTNDGTNTLTFTQIAAQAWGFRRRTWVFRAINTTGSDASGTFGFNFDLATKTYNEHFWSVDKVTGADTTTPNDAPTYETPTAGTSITVDDVGTPGAGDSIFAAFYTDDTTQSSTSAALTDLGDQSGGANVRSLITSYDLDAGDETPSATCASHELGGLGFIVNVAAGGAATSKLVVLNRNRGM